MKKLLAVLAISIFICGCQKDLTECVDPQISRETPVNLTKEGILKFESQSAFDQCMNEILQNPTNGIAIVDKYVGKSDGTRSNPNRIFNSIARIRADRETRVTPVVGQPIDYNDVLFVPEMTEEEFRDYIIDELLVDEELTYVLDSDLRIVVADTVYQITTDGVFFASYDNITIMEDVIEMYDPDMILNGEFEYLTYVGEGRYQYRDVVIIPNPDTGLFDPLVPVDPIIPIDPEDPTDPTDPNDPIDDSEDDDNTEEDFPIYFPEQFAKCDNIKTYAYRAPIIALNSLDQGLYEEKNKKGAVTNEFSDGKFRVKCRLHSVDYEFYKSVGYKIKFQQLKSFLGINYWVKAVPDRMEITINRLDVNVDYKLKGQTGTPYGGEEYYKIPAVLNGAYAEYVVRLMQDEVALFTPFKATTDIIAGTIHPLQLNSTADWLKIYDVPAKQVYSVMKSLEGKTIYAPLYKQVSSTDLRTAMVCWGGKAMTHNYFMGVMTYPNANYEETPKKAGFTIYRGGGVGFNEDWEFDVFETLNGAIGAADILGSVEYNGEVRGCRFLIYEKDN